MSELSESQDRSTDEGFCLSEQEAFSFRQKVRDYLVLNHEIQEARHLLKTQTNTLKRLRNDIVEKMETLKVNKCHESRSGVVLVRSTTVRRKPANLGHWESGFEKFCKKRRIADADFGDLLDEVNDLREEKTETRLKLNKSK